MQTAKEMAKELIEQLPETATLDEIMYRLYVKQKIEQGLEDSREGRVTPHDQVKLRYGTPAD
ncbi:MAG TPA: hypothetical protein VJA19_09530 [Pseudomonas sp.]|nr:hypothetical protein [Pseudomonas sp.]